MKFLLFKIAAVLLIVCAVFFIWTKFTSGANREFAQADDFPRGALVYAQFRDLPALIKLWDESELKRRYLASRNFEELQRRHLALKLLSRWQEFDDALGFATDAATLAGATQNRAAVAVYDIGKLEFVFVAPLSPEKFAATMFFQNQGNFEETTLADGTIFYSREVKADRGRQTQKILFALTNGRFVLATSENLLLRSLANINRKTRGDSLTDEPNFQNLANRFQPHLATVWVEQTKLNQDWYFKKYWAMRNVADLKNIRAGIFDFEMRGEKIIERREFLLTENFSNPKISPDEAARLRALIPAQTPFFKLQSIKPDKAAMLARDVLLDRLPAIETDRRGGRWNGYDSFDYENSSDYYDYSYLGSDYDENVSEPEEAEEIVSRRENETRLPQIFAAAQPAAAVFAAEPHKLNEPLFVEFRKAAIFALRSPARLDRRALENAVVATVQNRVAVTGEKLDLTWSDAENWRELKLPALGWEICYAVKNRDLIIADNAELLSAILKNQNVGQPQTAVDELTVIRFGNRREVFDGVMNRLVSDDKRRADFLTGNIGSLLDSLEGVSHVEIRKNHAANRLLEEIQFYLK